MTIQALIPIVPQNQNFVRWNGDRTIIVSSIFICKRFIFHLPVYVKLSFLHFNDVTLLEGTGGGGDEMEGNVLAQENVDI